MAGAVGDSWSGLAKHCEHAAHAGACSTCWGDGPGRSQLAPAQTAAARAGSCCGPDKLGDGPMLWEWP
jgi:hypothetical protein